MASLTNRYTEALFQAAQAEGSLAQVEADLAWLAVALGERQLRLLLENPQVERAEKRRVLESVLRQGGQQPHQRTLRFLDVMLARGRQSLLADVARAFRARSLEARGEVEGRLDTALPIDAADLELIAASLGRQVGKKVRLEVSQDDSLIGGFRVRVGDRMFDTSLRGQIEALGRKLKAIPIEELRARA
jgi:F-type H+-transporting ATPase subunit delta